MKVIVTNASFYLLRFDKPDEVIKGLIAFCDEQNITAGHFTGLGACGKVILSYYDLANKKYLDKTFSEDLEIVSLTGNIAKLTSETVIHAHGVFSDKNFQTYGGHVKELIVSATCEIHLTRVTGEMNRGFDKSTGLNLLQ